MNTKSLLLILAQIESLTDSAKTTAQANNKSEFWQRDKMFISDVRDCLASNDSERLRWVLDQMRNLSQGFGSYCNDLKCLDDLLDKFHSELVQFMSSQ